MKRKSLHKSPREKLHGGLRKAFRSYGLESLEERTVLTADAGFYDILWQGEDHTAIQGSWILSIDGMSGNLLSQQAEAQHRLDAMGLGSSLTVASHLGATGLFHLESAADWSYEQVLASVTSLSGFAYLEPDFLLTIEATPNDTRYGEMWGLNNTGASGGVVDADIDAPEAWNISTGSSSVVVGIVDTGIDYNHPDLAANIWVNPGEIAGDGLDNDGNGYIDDIHGWDFYYNDSDPMDYRGHGTHVAGTVGAVGNNSLGVVGINWDVSLMALKIADDVPGNRSVSGSAATAALNYVAMMNHDYGTNVRVTNHSWGGGGFSQALYNAIAANEAENILLVAAAGNDTSDTDINPQYPANYNLPNVISVAATTRTDALAGFSNYGATTVDLGAPGASILSTLPNNSYGNYNGTSMATPHVVGVAALAWSLVPNASYQQVKDAILAGADPIPALAGITVTGGRLNAANTLALMGLYVASSTPVGGSIIATTPTDYTITFSDAYDPLTLQASDFSVNNIQADTFTPVNSTTVTFHFNATPVTLQGLQTMRIAAGSILRQGDGFAINNYVSTFRYDVATMTATLDTPVAGSIATWPISTIVFNFSEPINPASVGLSDLILSQGTVTHAQALTSTSVAYTVAGIDAETVTTVQLRSDSVLDQYSNPMAPYSGTFEVDYVDRDVTSWERLDPLGSYAFQADVAGLISNASDVDRLVWTSVVGETYLAVLKPNDPSAIFTGEFEGLGSPVVGSAGGTVILPLVTASANGPVTLRVSADRRTSYTVSIYRNTELDLTPAGGTLQDITATGVDLGSTRYAVVGEVSAATVSGTRSTIYSANMSNNPGWTLTGAWAYGVPQGLAGDPSSGYTGSQVIGYNLAGAYSNSMTVAQTATTTAISTLGYDNVNLSFRRWLGVERSTLDRASIQVSNNGTTWTTIYSNPTSNVVDTSWQLVTYNISSVADDHATVYVRWNMGPTNSSNTFSGWNIDDVVIDGNQILPSVDEYTLTVSTSEVSSLDIALAGQGSTNFAGQTLQLIDPNGLVVATSSPVATSSVNTTYSDLEINGYVPQMDGVYKVRFTSFIAGKYGIVVTTNSEFDAAPNDSAAGVLPPLSTSGANGYLGTTLDDRTYSLTVDTSQSALVISGWVSGFGDPTLNPLIEQVAGSLVATPSGMISLVVSGQTVHIDAATLIDFLQQAGNVNPGGAPADFSGSVVIQGTPINAAARSVTASAEQTPVALGSDDSFSVFGMNFELTGGEFAYGLGSLQIGTYDLPGLSANNQSTTKADIAIVPGFVTVTTPVEISLDATVPIFTSSLTLQLILQGQVVAQEAWGDGADYYTLTLAQGETVVLSTETPLDGTGVGNDLDAMLRVFDSGDNLLASDDDGAGDGRNARLLFTAPAAGTYKIQVAGLSGLGEYHLSVDPYVPLSASAGGPYVILEGESLILDASASTGTGALEYSWDVNGDGVFGDAVGVQPTLSWSELVALGIVDNTTINQVAVQVTDILDGVATSSLTTLTIDNAAPTAEIAGPGAALRGESLTFVLTAIDPSVADQNGTFTFAIDWDGDTVVDQTVMGPSGTTVSHAFNDTGWQTIRVTATDKDGGTSSQAIYQQSVADWALRPNDLNPLLLDLHWSGTTGADDVSFEVTGADQITVRLALLNGIASTDVEVINGVTGQIVVYGRAGNDNLDASLLIDRAAALYGNQGNDTLHGGAREDQLFGDSDGGEGGGDDLIIAGDGDDTITADGAEGNDDTVQGGAGNDVIASDPSGGEGGADVVYGDAGNDLIDSGDGQDVIDGGADDDILIGAGDPSGAEGSADTITGGAGRDLLIGGAGIDSLTGGAGEDLIITGSVGTVLLVNQYAGLYAVQTAWLAPDPLPQRQANIDGSPGSTLDPAFVLTPGVTVLDDAAVDTVVADDDADSDWVIRALADDVVSADLFDVLTDL